MIDWHQSNSNMILSAKWWTKVNSPFTMIAGVDTQNVFNASNIGSNDTFNFFDDARLVSLIKHRGTNQSTNIGDWLRALEDLRNKYNISLVKECDRSDYCSGEFRDLILAYNSIHGYISLLVSILFNWILTITLYWVWYGKRFI